VEVDSPLAPGLCCKLERDDDGLYVAGKDPLLGLLPKKGKAGVGAQNVRHHRFQLTLRDVAPALRRLFLPPALAQDVEAFLSRAHVLQISKNNVSNISFSLKRFKFKLEGKKT
jgi:hypothetical protein